jgi:type I restriction enzyme S subunit
MQTQRLDAVADITMGQAPEGESYNLDGEGLPLIAGAGDFGELHPDPKKFTTTPGKTCQRGDVILGIRATIGEKVLADRTYCLGRGVAGLRAKSGLDERYLWHWLTYVVPALAAKARGATFKQVNREDIGELHISLPLLPKQRQIAEILDKADSLRAKRRAALAQLNTLTQSIFLDLFGDPAIPTRTVGQLLECGALLSHKDGNHGSLYPRPDDFDNEGIPFLSAKAVSDDGAIDNGLVENLREEKADRLKIGWILKGDVLLAHNASVGKVALYDGRFERALIGTSLTAFRPNPEALNSNYLAAALRAPTFQRQLEKNMGQTTRNQVPITAQRNLKVGLPRIELQKEFAQKAMTVEALMVSYRASVMRLDALFASLQQRVFEGGLLS